MINQEFGKLIKRLRQEKGWTTKEFIEKLGDGVSPAYITKIEVYGEIPSPEKICKMAEVLGYDPEKLLAMAKEKKIERFKQLLEDKYQEAFGLYRTQKKGKDSGT